MIGANSDQDVSVHDIRRWLVPHGHEPSFLLSDRISISSSRLPGTCSWFKPHLTAHMDNPNQTILLVNGPPGVGKTVLASWVMDELQAMNTSGDNTILSFHIRE
jgi:Cdc6-like AAA superfamily ATPase